MLFKKSIEGKNFKGFIEWEALSVLDRIKLSKETTTKMVDGNIVELDEEELIIKYVEVLNKYIKKISINIINVESPITIETVDDAFRFSQIADELFKVAHQMVRGVDLGN